MKSPGLTTLGPEGESYPAFQRRVAKEAALVKAKCDALDKFIPRCTACGETCDPADAGSQCKTNGMVMISRWAQEKGAKEFYRLGHFGGSWHNQERNLAVLLDLTRVEVLALAASPGTQTDKTEDPR